MSAPRHSVMTSVGFAVAGTFAGLLLFAFTSPDVTSPTGVIFMGGLGAVLGMVFLPRFFATPAKDAATSRDDQDPPSA